MSRTVLVPVLAPGGVNSLVPSGRDKGRSGQRVRQFTTRPGEASLLTGVAFYLGPYLIRLPFGSGPRRSLERSRVPDCRTVHPDRRPYPNGTERINMGTLARILGVFFWSTVFTVALFVLVAPAIMLGTLLMLLLGAL